MGQLRAATNILIMCIIVLFNSARGQEGDPEGKCLDKCGGPSVYEKETYDGKLLCHYIYDSIGGATMSAMTPKCNLECSGGKAAEDQAKCMCELCKDKDMHAYLDFCKEPGVKTHISIEECDTTVCKGKTDYKYRNIYCNAETPEDFENMKKEFKD